MARDDETEPRHDEADAGAETRLVLDDDVSASPEADADAAAETVLAETQSTSPAAEDVGLAETVVAEIPPASGAEVPDDSAGEDEDDRTQLVARHSTEGESAADPDAGTRVLDPGARPMAKSGRRVPDTRVIDEPDKTAPPPAGKSAAATSAAPRPSAPADPDRGLAPGTVLFGEYEVVNVLGVGGMGEVYRARHRRLEEHRAIKVMHAELSKKKGASEFFYREAKALLAVRHPAVVHCHDLLSDDQGRVYLIMEMIEGIPLSKKMNDGPLSPDDVAVLGARVSHGLAAAHRKGVIHRDLSPDNIVLPNGRVQEAKIIDFGIAKLLEEGEGTIVDGFKGKLSYASPEQLGFFGGKIDGRSDFYSLGLVLAAAALGKPMSMGTTVVEAVDARRNFSTLPDAIPMGLRSAIQPLLALDPDDRPRYVDRLFVVPSGTDGMTDPGRISTGGVARKPEKSGMDRAPLMVGAGLMAALVVGGVSFTMLSGSEEAPPAGATSRAENADGAGASADIDAAVEPPATVDTTNGQGSEPAVGVAEPEAVVEKPAKPMPRRISAGDRIKIIGLISNAKLALAENRLMSPANDNAYDRYVKVLDLDPNDARARAGLRTIATRYVGMADRAVDKGDLDEARTFLERARLADPTYEGIDRISLRLRQ